MFYAHAMGVRYKRGVRSLKWDMDALAVETWTRIHAGDLRGIRLREDTVTETNLLTLALQHPQVRLHRYNQHAERASGSGLGVVRRNRQHLVLHPHPGQAHGRYGIPAAPARRRG